MRLSRSSAEEIFHPEKELCFVHTCQFFFCQTSIHHTAQEQKATDRLKAGGSALKDTHSTRISQAVSLNSALCARP